MGPSVDLLLEQGRSRGLAFVLAHQTIDQLNRNSVDMLPVVQACTSTHIVVEATDAETVEYVQKRSGQAYFARTSWSQIAPADENDRWFGPDMFRAWKAVSGDGFGNPVVNVREEMGYRVDVNLIHKVSADPTGAFVAIKKNRGCANFDGFMIPMRSYFHIDRELFAARGREPWPTWDRPETVIVAMENPFATASRLQSEKPTQAGIQIIPGPPSVDAALRARLHQRNRREIPRRD